MKKFDSIQQSKFQLSKWKVLFFFTIVLFEKCLLGIEIAHSYLKNGNTTKLIDNLVPHWGSSLLIADFYTMVQFGAWHSFICCCCTVLSNDNITK